MPICTCNSAQHQYSLRKCKFKPLWNTTPTVYVLSCSAMSDFLWPHGLQPTRLLHLWNFPGKSTGVGCHCLLRQALCHLSKPNILQKVFVKLPTEFSIFEMVSEATAIGPLSPTCCHLFISLYPSLVWEDWREGMATSSCLCPQSMPHKRPGTQRPPQGMWRRLWDHWIFFHCSLRSPRNSKASWAS